MTTAQSSVKFKAFVLHLHLRGWGRGEVLHSLYSMGSKEGFKKTDRKGYKISKALGRWMMAAS